MVVRRALIVEDYQAAAEIFKELLEMFDFNVNYVMAGADAKQALTEAKYDVVFMDLNLPDISGFTLVKQLRATLQEEPPTFVAVSGFAKTDVGADARNLFDFYLEKPIEIASLEGILQSIDKT